jgi:hypothetical protein
MIRLASCAMATWLVLSAAAAAAQTPAPSFPSPQDMPEVLYVVPWKDSEQGLPLEPPRLYVDDTATLEPLDRDRFLRELRHRAAARNTSPSAIRTP